MSQYSLFFFIAFILPSTKTKPRKVKVAPIMQIKTGMAQSPTNIMKSIEVTERSFARVRICSSHDCELILSPVKNTDIYNYQNHKDVKNLN